MSNTNNSDTEEIAEESKVMMEDLRIKSDTTVTTNQDKDGDTEMSLEERMNWLRERVSEFVL
jgi:hypothetical protein